MGNDPQNNVVLARSYEFALQVISLGTRLQREEREYVLSRQLVRSGTSIGANVEEAQAAQSRPDFHTKMCQAAKEARECHYWLRLIRDSFPAMTQVATSLVEPAEELKRLLGAITKATKS